jgi:membrane protein YqaA with SNARE-associated domain
MMAENTDNDSGRDTDRDHDPCDGTWTSRLARHRTGLAALSFAESTVVPIPLETIAAPLMVGHHRQAWVIATAIWIGCLLGASLFYFAGLWLSEPVVQPALDWLGLREDFEEMSRDLEGSGLFWTVFLVSFSPAPMQFATLGAGTVGGNFLLFLGAIAASRGLRYFGLALAARIFGPRIARLNVPKGRIVLAVFAVLIAGWGILQLTG